MGRCAHMTFPRLALAIISTCFLLPQLASAQTTLTPSTVACIAILGVGALVIARIRVAALQLTKCRTVAG